MKMTNEKHYANLARQMGLATETIRAIREDLVETRKAFNYLRPRDAHDNTAEDILRYEPLHRGVCRTNDRAQMLSALGWTEADLKRKVDGVLVYMKGEKLVKIDGDISEVL